ncbi:MAG: diadenylate cyclase CdaA [Candidatus Omnitrophica bacterium]|nr:diadenylate cyclase CdaA [Candidatus Omnitrophota bacterium]MDD5042386.1 diadenylate cyclase CdaA [Candidatus Omnitrophota bacterium]MDD5501548.1 diadenylate cyclase CdaA [Candidatus Omnitrophota bacterium]
MHSLFPYWKPVIEVIILWFFIYHIILFFAGTRSLQVIRGLIVLLLVFLVSQRFDFIVLDWLLKKLFGISVIAILIIFHPEIRQGLAQLGKRNIFRNMVRDENPDSFVKQIVEASEKLAENKIGGLIAIEKNDSLASYIQSGETVDARVSADLIQAIFTPNNPLHDGALVVQHGRISAAGCIFPLVISQELNRVFGTRHRAALSLSEETDAILIVVSEERRDISVVYRRKFYRDLGGQELEAKIKELIRTKKDE